MISGLFINACILVSALFIFGQVFSFVIMGHKVDLKFKLLLGISGGILGIVLMMYSISVSDHIIFDFRHFALMIVAIIGDATPVLFASVIMAAFRLLNFGISTQSYITSGVILLLGVGCSLIGKQKLSLKSKWMVMSVYCVLAISTMMFFVVEDTEAKIRVIASLWLGTAVIGTIVIYLIQYLVMSYNLVKRLKEESTVDFLTGLYNTRSFDDIFNKAVEISIEKKEKLAMLILDIDFFKKINDTYGHKAGDIVLKDLGQLLLKNCRGADTVARIGGEEFAVIIRDMSPVEVKAIAERIRNQVEKNIFQLPQNKINLTISIGAAVYPDTVESLEYLKEIADNKLYEAKRTGRNKVCI